MTIDSTVPAAATAFHDSTREVIRPDAIGGDVPALWKPGDVILGIYDVIDVNASGGMGMVYRVRHRGWHVELALKSPRPEFFATERDKQTFEAECNTWVNLGLHPHIACCYYVRRLGDIPRIFAEFVAGGSLAEWIRSGRLYAGGSHAALARVLDVAIQFAWGLHYAHEQALVHQDVKPGNVLMTAEGVAKVTDFGLAKARGSLSGSLRDAAGGSERSLLVSAGGMTPAYCSPEQAAGARLSAKTDIWSWGLSVLEMFLGELTWMSGQAAPQVLESIREIQPARPELPPMVLEVFDLLQRCFRENPADRPESMLDISQTLQEIYEVAIGVVFPRSRPQAAELRADTLTNRGASYFDLARENDAIATWADALKVEPAHLQATFNASMSAWDRGEIDDRTVIDRLERAGSGTDDAPARHFLLGLAHLSRVDADSAERELTQAHATYRDYVDVGLALGDAYLAKGDYDRAGDEYHRALETAPGHSPAIQRLALARNRSPWSLLPFEQASRFAPTGTPPRCLRTFEGHRMGVRGAVCTPDGRYCLSADGEGLFREWDLHNGRCLAVFGNREQVLYRLTMTPDARHLIATYIDGSACIWNRATHQQVHRLEKAASVAVSPSGRQLLSAGEDGEIRLWDLATGECVRVFEQADDPGAVLAFCDDHSAIWAGSTTSCAVYSLSTGEMLAALDHRATVTCLTVDPQRNLSLIGGETGPLCAFDLATGRLLKSFDEADDRARCVAISRDGRRAITGDQSARKVRIWEMATGRCLSSLEGHEATGSMTYISMINVVTFTPDARFALSGGFDDTLRLWEIDRAPRSSYSHPVVVTPRNVTELLDAEHEFRRHIEGAREALSKNDVEAAFSALDEARRIPGYDQAVPPSEVLDLQTEAAQLFNLERRGVRHVWAVHSIETGIGAVQALAVSPDAQRLLAFSYPQPEVWEIAPLRQVGRFEPIEFAPTVVDIDATGRIAVSAGNEPNVVRVWDVATGQCTGILQGEWFVATSVAISPDAKYAAACGESFRAFVWDVASGELLHVLADGEHCAERVAFTPHGRTVTAGMDGDIKVWDTPTGTCLQTLLGHDDRVFGTCVAHDGRMLMSCSKEGAVRVWELATGTCLQEFRPRNGMLLGMALTPDDRMLLVCGTHGGSLWDLETGTQMADVFSGQSIKSCRMTPDGRYAFAVDVHGKLLCWQFDWEFIRELVALGRCDLEAERSRLELYRRQLQQRFDPETS